MKATFTMWTRRQMLSYNLNFFAAQFTINIEMKTCCYCDTVRTVHQNLLLVSSPLVSVDSNIIGSPFHSRSQCAILILPCIQIRTKRSDAQKKVRMRRGVVDARTT